MVIHGSQTVIKYDHYQLVPCTSIATESINNKEFLNSVSCNDWKQRDMHVCQLHEEATDL